jgi:hypothetical protein
MRHIKVLWDLGDNNNGEPKTFIDAGLPEIVAVPEWMDESEISDWLEDVFDYPPLEYFEFDFSEKNI